METRPGPRFNRSNERYVSELRLLLSPFSWFCIDRERSRSRSRSLLLRNEAGMAIGDDDDIILSSIVSSSGWSSSRSLHVDCGESGVCASDRVLRIKPVASSYSDRVKSDSIALDGRGGGKRRSTFIMSPSASDRQPICDAKKKKKIRQSTVVTTLNSSKTYFLWSNRFLFQWRQHHMQQFVCIMFIGRNHPSQCV